MNKYTIPAYILPSEHFFGELRAVEVRFNDCHDPITGRFAPKYGYSNVLSENPYNEGKNNRITRPTDIKVYAGGGTSKNGLTKTESSDIIDFENNQKKLFEALSAGKASTKINKQQGKHIKGNPLYEDLIAKGKHPGYLTVKKMEAQTIINNYFDKGKTYLNGSGFKVVFQSSKNWGIYVDQYSGKEFPTSRGTIHIGKDGAHLVPAYPFPEE